jgi:hypothetical protein
LPDLAKQLIRITFELISVDYISKETQRVFAASVDFWQFASV